MDRYSYELAVYAAQQHKLIHHYTTFNSLQKIIGNGSLRLTRTDLLNDAIENKMLLDLWKCKVYVSCFTHREQESYFFWKTYAKSNSEGVMISFVAEHLNESTIHPDEKCIGSPLCPCERSTLDAKFSPEVTSEDWGVFDYSCVDVMYLPRNEETKDIKNYQGRLKYAEWDMECETRIRVALRPKCLEFKAERGRCKYLTPQNEYIYAHLSDEVLGSMRITLSPFADENLRVKVERLLQDNNLLDKVPVINSVLTGEAQ